MAGDADLVASNIKTGVNIFNVEGAVQVPLASQVLSGVNFDVNTMGNVVLPSSGDVRQGVNFGANSALIGGLDPGAGVPANCSSDGQTNCVAITNFPAVDRTTIASKVLNTASVAGVAGNVTLPSVGDVYFGTNYGVNGSSLTGTLTLADAANVRSSQGVFGRNGNSVTPSLNDCGADGAT